MIGGKNYFLINFLGTLGFLSCGIEQEALKKNTAKDKIFQYISKDRYATDRDAAEVLGLFKDIKFEIDDDFLDKICSMLKKDTIKSNDVIDFIRNNTNNIKSFTKLFEVCPNEIIDVELLRTLIERANKEGSDQLLKEIDKSRYATNINASEILCLFKNIKFQISDDSLEKICSMLGEKSIQETDIYNFIKDNYVDIDNFKSFFRICPENKYSLNISGDYILTTFQELPLQIEDKMLEKLCNHISIKINNKEYLINFIKNNSSNISDISPLFGKYNELIDPEILEALIDSAKKTKSNKIFSKLDQKNFATNLEPNAVLSLFSSLTFQIDKVLLENICKMIDKDKFEIQDIVDFVNDNYHQIIDPKLDNHDHIEDFEPLFDLYQKKVDDKNLPQIIEIAEKHLSDRIFNGIQDSMLAKDCDGDNIISAFQNSERQTKFDLSERSLEKICGMISDKNELKITEKYIGDNVLNSKAIVIFIQNNCSKIEHFKSLKDKCLEQSHKPLPDVSVKRGKIYMSIPELQD